MEKIKSKITLMPDERKRVIKIQITEVTEYHIYKLLARKATDKNHKNILNTIADDELRHYKTWMKYSKTEVDPNKWMLFVFIWLVRLFGLEYGIKKMEKGENRAKLNYAEMGKFIPEAVQLSREESHHQNELIKILKRDKQKI